MTASFFPLLSQEYQIAITRMTSLIDPMVVGREVYSSEYRPIRYEPSSFSSCTSCADRPKNKFKNLTIKGKEAVKTATTDELMSIKLAAPMLGAGPLVAKAGSSNSLNREVLREGERRRGGTG